MKRYKKLSEQLKSLYRVCSFKEAEIFLQHKKYISSLPFTSLTEKWKNLLSSDDFEDAECVVEFDFSILKKQNKLIKIIYEPKWLNKFPKIKNYILHNMSYDETSKEYIKLLKSLENLENEWIAPRNFKYEGAIIVYRALGSDIEEDISKKYPDANVTYR